MLKVKEQIKEADGRVFVYEMSQSGDVFTIQDPNLKMELEQVQIGSPPCWNTACRWKANRGRPSRRNQLAKQTPKPRKTPAIHLNLRKTEAPEPETYTAAEQVPRLHARAGSIPRAAGIHIQATGAVGTGSPIPR